jgi:putative oxidoreductase
VMSTAVRKVHLKNGPWITDGGYEYNLALVAALVALADVGPGHVSLDHALGIEVKGPLVALLALAAGIGGAAVMTAGAEPEGAAPAAPEAPAAQAPAQDNTSEDAPATA